MITNGSLQAFSFIARHHVQAGTKVFVEAPCYDRSLQILRRLGAEVETVPLSDDGLDIDALEHALEETGRPRLVYDPDVSNPSGRTLSEPNRHRLIEVARAHDVVILEDDPYGLLRFGGEGLPRLFKLAGGEGAMLSPPSRRRSHPASASTSPSCPRKLMGAMQTLILENYVSPVMFVEATLREFVSRGRFDPNVEAIQEALHLRRDAMISALAREMPEGTRWNEPDGGYFLWVDLPGGPERREPPRAGRRGRCRVHQGARLLLRRRRRVVASPRVLLRAARGDRRGGRAARTARARRRRRPRVTSSSYRTAHLDDLDRFGGEFDTIPIRIPLGIAAFGINAYGAREAGGQVIEEHDKLGAGAGLHEELYLVLSGQARFTVAGDEARRSRRHLGLRPRPGDQARRDGRRARHDRARRRRDGGEGVRAIALGVVARGAPFYEAKDFDAAAAVLGQADVGIQTANVLFNLACCEALAGRREDALGHLRRAAELDPRVREWAASDTDLDSIRDAL